MRRHVWVCAAVLALLGGLSACSGGGGKPVVVPPVTRSPSASPSASPASTVAAARAEILRQYSGFRAHEREIQGAPASKRPQLLERYVTDPAFTTALQSLEALDAFHRGYYGTTTGRVTSLDVAATSAVLRDCRDESQAGQIDLRTHKKINRGTAATPYAITWKKVDDTWKISSIRLEASCAAH